MSDTPQRLPYEPMDERQRAIEAVRALEVTRDGDVFDLLARMQRQIDTLIARVRELECSGEKGVINVAVEPGQREITYSFLRGQGES